MNVTINVTLVEAYAILGACSNMPEIRVKVEREINKSKRERDRVLGNNDPDYIPEHIGPYGRGVGFYDR